MNPWFVLIYFICFALIAGAAFAMMWSNIQSINVEMNKPKPKPRHPEAPDPGDEVMYVDLSREKLENLYNDKPTPYKVREIIMDTWFNSIG